MRTLLSGWAWLTLGGLGCLGADTGPPLVLQRAGPVSLTTTAALDQGVVQLPLSGLLRLTVRFDNPGPVELEAPLRIAAHMAWESRPAAAGGPPNSCSVVLEPLLPGRHQLQLEPLRWRRGQEPWQIVTWQPIEVKVNTLMGRPDLQDLRDITAIEDLPAPVSRWGGWWSALLVLLGGSGLLVWACWSGRRWRRGSRPAAVSWSRRLERLLVRNLPAAGHGRRFHALLSRLIRGYVEKQWQLPARRRPIAETLQAAAALLPAHRQSALADILHRCAWAQFSPQPPSLEECRQAGELAQAFLAQPTP